MPSAKKNYAGRKRKLKEEGKDVEKKKKITAKKGILLC